MKKCILGLIVSQVLSCTSDKSANAVRYAGQEQLLTLNEANKDGSKRQAPVVSKISSDTISIGNEFVAKIFISDSTVEIVNAFFECQPVQTPAVDTVTHVVRGCSKQLLVQNDTIFIGLLPTQSGLQDFPVITILTKDHENIFRTYNYHFQYNVIQ